MLKHSNSASFHATCLAFVFGIIILGLLIATIQAGTACINEKGCAKNWCPLKSLKKDAKALISAKNEECGSRNPLVIS